MKKCLLLFIMVLSATFLAIGSKVLISNEINIEIFDGFLVKLVGFEITATLYFILIYGYIALITKFIANRLSRKGIKFGLRLGLVFFLIFLVGMQEVVVEVSPFSSWGFDFVKYQFMMGIGEALIALLLCLSIEFILFKKEKCISIKSSTHFCKKASSVLMIATFFVLFRSIAYETTLIGSNVASFPIPSFGWTIIFGIIVGISFVILYPLIDQFMHNYKRNLLIVIFIIGFSWLLFNSFIGFIASGTMGDVLLRSSIDILSLIISTFLVDRMFLKTK